MTRTRTHSVARTSGSVDSFARLVCFPHGKSSVSRARAVTDLEVRATKYFPRVALVIGLFLLSLGVRAEIRVAVENGFDTSAPLEASFVRVRLENTGEAPHSVVLTVPGELIEQRIELPPVSRKEVPLIVNRPGPVIIRSGERELLRSDIQSQFTGATILVIAGRETGLRVLNRDSLGGGTGLGPIQPSLGGPAVTTPPPALHAGPVRVLTTLPGRLPESIWGYRSLGQQLLLVIHPGGFDLMTPSQRDALRVTATYFADTVLVSEGRVDAFTGTPVEDLVPGAAVSVTSYDEWSAHFSGATAEPAALSVFQPARDAEFSETSVEGLPLFVQRPQNDRLVTYMAFDYSAPPLRAWNSKSFWYGLIRTGTPDHEPPIQALTASLLEWDRKRQSYRPPPPLRLALAGATLALGYAAIAFGTRRLYRQPLSGRNWVTGPGLLTLIFGVAVGFGAIVGNRRAVLTETSVLVPQGDSAFFRNGQLRITGPGRLSGPSSQSPAALVQSDHAQGVVLGKMSFASLAPPAIADANLNQLGELRLSAFDVLPFHGQLGITAVRKGAAHEYQVRLTNASRLSMGSLRIFIDGDTAELGDVASGDTRLIEASMRRASVLPVGQLPEVLAPPEEAIVALAAQASRGQFSPDAIGLAVARLELPSMLSGTGGAEQYLIVPVTPR